jgi:hypothetical protein
MNAYKISLLLLILEIIQPHKSRKASLYRKAFLIDFVHFTIVNYVFYSHNWDMIYLNINYSALADSSSPKLLLYCSMALPVIPVLEKPPS